MDEQIIREGDMSPQYQEAVEVTRRIKMNGSIAADALYQVCKDLKLMRDKKLYIELGFGSFDEYTEAAIGIKPRQAYNYISTYERFGDTVLQSNAKLGITKLALLSEVPAVDRDDVMKNNDIAGMSTREVEDLVKKLKDTGEQLNLITSERDKALSGVDELETFKAKVAELEKQLAEPKPDEAAIEKTKKAAIKEAEKAAKEKLQTEIDKAVSKTKSESEKKLAEAVALARSEGIQAGEKAINDKLKVTEVEKANALERASALERKLAVAGNQETVIILHLSEEIQSVFGKVIDTISKMRTKDPAAADKFTEATRKLMTMLASQL